MLSFSKCEHMESRGMLDELRAIEEGEWVGFIFLLVVESDAP